MLLQVKTMSSHQWAAGTRQWNSHSDCGGPDGLTSSTSGSEDCAHRERTVAGCLSAAGIPSASQAQLAKYDTPTLSTKWMVGTPENGGAIRIEAPSSSSTSTRFPASRR